MPENNNFQVIRKEYANVGIDANQLPEDPFVLFRQWYDTAEKNQPADWVEANAMSLATCDQLGRVSNRYVLLKGIDDDGIRFYTNYDSEKGQQIAENPRAAAAFLWAYLSRQIRIEGTVEKTSRDDSRRYFHSRPLGAQIGAAVSQQSSTLESRQQLEHLHQQLQQRHADQRVPLPENWGGYRIVVDRFEFWQGRTNRLHDRIVYKRLVSGDWKRSRISP